ncbi:unknown [Coprobacillus sp. CAG:235]|nr:unknown [Coprobacillus sp. CAG:235]
MIVVGPSLIRETFIIAPKIPVSVWTPAFSNALLKYSYNGFDISGLAASKKLGLLPFLQFAYKVNCEIERISPLISINDKFNFSFSSSKILKLISLLIILSTISSLSSFVIPTNTINPCLICPFISPSISTLASLTLCTTNLIFISTFLFIKVL